MIDQRGELDAEDIGKDLLPNVRTDCRRCSLWRWRARCPSLGERVDVVLEAEAHCLHARPEDVAPRMAEVKTDERASRGPDREGVTSPEEIGKADQARRARQASASASSSASDGSADQAAVSTGEGCRRSPCSHSGSQSPGLGWASRYQRQSIAWRIGDDEDVPGSTELDQPVARARSRPGGVGSQHVVGATDIDRDAFFERGRRAGRGLADRTGQLAGPQDRRRSTRAWPQL